jgi:hypothetical protein
MPILPLEMGRKSCQWIKETFGHFNELGLWVFQIHKSKSNQKILVGAKNLGAKGKNK